MDSPRLEAPYWSQSADAVITQLGSSQQGLSSKDAQERLNRLGPNLVSEEPRLTALRLLLRQFESPLVLILIFGACVRWMRGHAEISRSYFEKKSAEGFRVLAVGKRRGPASSITRVKTRAA